MLRKRKILVVSSLVCIGAAICFLAWYGANSDSDDDTMAMRIVGKWIQEYSSQAALMQTEFSPDGRVIIKKYVLIAAADMERYSRLLPASVESLHQPQRKRTYYWINDIALRGGKYLQGTVVQGSWLIENGRLVQRLESNVYGTTETSGRITTLTEARLVLSYERQGQEVSFWRQDRWETATAALDPWLRITDQTDSARLGKGPRRHHEKVGAFSYDPPAGWQITEFPALKYRISHGPREDEFAPNINVIDEAFPGTLAAFVEGNLKGMKKFSVNLKVLTREDLTTQDNEAMVKVVTENEQQGRMLRQTFFFTGSGNRKYLITCTALADGGAKFDTVFDDSVKTFRMH